MITESQNITMDLVLRQQSGVFMIMLCIHIACTREISFNRKTFARIIFLYHSVH